MRPRLVELEIHAHFLAKDFDAAAMGVDRMIREFPDAAPTARACRRLAQRVESTDPARAAKYYAAWLDRTATIPYTTSEVLQVADGLYRVARELNQFGTEVASALDLRGKAPANRAVWADAARAYAMVAPGKGIPEDDAVRAARHLVWCAGFQAQTADDWAKAKTLSESLLQTHGALKNGVFVPVVVAGKKWLLGVYLEYGHALVQLGRGGQKFQYGNALTVFNDVLQATPEESESWWISKYMAIRCFFERGEGSDIRTAAAALSLLESNRPGFDGGKYGLKSRFAELQAEIQKAVGPQR
jgi:hypothetical protein